MAYIKYKELAQYFNFYKKMDINNLPAYVTDYVGVNEYVMNAYETMRDKCIFTDKKLVLFDRRGLGGTKKIHFFPYKSISSSAILYKKNKISLLFSFDSGYQLKLNFIRMSPSDTTELRKTYFFMMEKSINI